MAEDDQPAGLYVPERKGSRDADGPRGSLLGLDRLAAAKRAEGVLVPSAVTPSATPARDGDDERLVAPPRRHYRRATEETPSRGSELDRAALTRRAERDARDRDLRGLREGSGRRDGRAHDSRGRPPPGLPPSSSRRDRSRSPGHFDDRGAWGDRGREASRGRSSWDEREPSRTRSDRWEETPRRHGDVGGRVTPRHTGSGGGWTPTPRHGERGERGERGGSSWTPTPRRDERGGGSGWTPTPRRDERGGGDSSAAPVLARARLPGSTPAPFATPGAIGSTPVAGASGGGSGGSDASAATRELAVEEAEREERDLELDREWYDAEEEGAVDETRDPFAGWGGEDGPGGAGRGGPSGGERGPLTERLTRRDGSAMTLAQSARASEARRDADAWEENRLLTSGVAVRAARDPLAAAAEDAADAERAVLVVRDARPTFLKDAPLTGKAAAPVLPLRDPTSDMAVIARQGSALVARARQQRDQARGRAKFWQVAGSKMGGLTGVTDREAEDKALADEELRRREGSDDDQSGSEDERGGPGGGGGRGGGGGDNRGDDDRGGGQRRRRSGRNTFAAAMTGPSVAASAFAKTRTISEQRRSLPVFEVRDELLELVRENQIVVVVGETGSGKTTQMTQYLLEAGFAGEPGGRDSRAGGERARPGSGPGSRARAGEPEGIWGGPSGARGGAGGGLIGCTQPRRVAAMSVAKRVSEEMGVELGGEVGYSIRFEDVTSEHTVIKYMTDGVLLRESLSDPDLDRYSCVIMDEAHERSLNTDVLFGVLRGVVSRRRDLRLVVTSATLDSQRFSDYFGGVPVFRIPGRTFPVEVLHSRTPQEDYVEALVKQCLAAHLGHPPGDVLAFVTGQEEIEAACEELAARLERLGDRAPPALVLPVYSQLPADLQARIFEPAPGGERKIVVATNIAETSLTLDGVRYVVDGGYAKLKVYNPRAGMDVLAVFPESRAAADQRAGRAGRTGPGTCWRLFTRSAYDREMLRANVPEIQRTSLAATALQLASLGLDPATFPFMDAPPRANLAHSRFSLWALGALDDAGALTPAGARMAAFPLDPALSALLLAGCSLGCGGDALTLVAMLSVPPVWFRPRDRADEADRARERFLVPESDHLTLVNVYDSWDRAGRRADWCTTHFLQQKGLRKAREVRGQLEDLAALSRLPVRERLGAGDNDPLRRAVAASHALNAARLRGLGEYVACRTAVRCHLHPTSALFGLGLAPDYVIYHEIVSTTKEYMQCVTAVEPAWLAEAAPAFYSVRRAADAREAARARQRAAERLESAGFGPDGGVSETPGRVTPGARPSASSRASSGTPAGAPAATLLRAAALTPGSARSAASTPRRPGVPTPRRSHAV